MFKSNSPRWAAVILLLASLACTSQTVSISTPDAVIINTSIAQTISAALTQTHQPLVPITGLESPTATELPTLSPTATLSPTPIFTATPVIPQITVSVATNCRVGPGKVYDRVGALLVGDVAEVVGMNPTGEYWYIRNPSSNNNGYCWLWGEYATLAGNLSVLPVFTPPPTPTPSSTSTPAPGFDVSYDSLETCSGWWVDLKLKNTGSIAFRSISITLRDTVNDTVLSLSADNFTNNDGCSGSSIKDILNPGDVRVVSASPFAYDPTGHKIRATITMCSNKAISGTCVTQVIEFKP